MNRSYFKWIVVLAALSVVIVTIFMVSDKFTDTTPPPTPITPRPHSPFKTYISAVGVVEANGGNIFIGAPVNRVVDKIDVVVGQKVKEGQILFQLESNDLQADLVSRGIDYEDALANLKKLQALPREEDIASATAVLKSVKSEYEQAKSQYLRVEGLQNSGAMSQEEIARRRFAYEEAEAKYEQAQASFEKTKGGAWPPDLEIARLKVKQTKALMQRLEADISRTIIRSPSNATVLQIKIHEGEFPPSDSSSTPSMIVGNTDVMSLRVSINQFDAPYFNFKAKAVAFLQGNANIEFPLKFLRLEPYLVTKQNLNNSVSEKVDTRVLQAIYCFKEGENRVFVGQQMDVYIETQFNTSESQ